MVPYFEQPILRIGSVDLQTFHLLVVLGAAVGYRVAVRRAVHTGLARGDAAHAVAWAIAWGFVGSHLFEVIAYHPALLTRDPVELLRVWGGMSSFGGILGGLLAAFVVMRHRAMTPESMARLVDAVAFAFPFAWIFGRTGCALAHDHPGIPTTHWLAVRFPGGPRFDLGLLELLCTLGIAALFAALARRERPTGFFVGLFFALYGPLRFALDMLRTDDARYFGWTPAQYLSLVGAVVGLCVLAGLARRRLPAPALPR